MKIAVEGCAHGELEKIYDSIQFLENQENIKVDLLICCGDFQSTRNKQDLQCMAVPMKHQKMCTFYKYYSGEKTAPILTLFIGGNHEASNYLQELAHGGWVAPNIYYMGYASVVNVGGVRIGGISGIYKGYNYMKGHFEKAPYNEDTKRSVYHVRNLEVYRLKQVKEPIDIMLSHDWPRGVYNYGNVGKLLEMKPFFMEDIQNDRLGSKPSEELLRELKPKFWFAAHLHVKFAAIVPHAQEGDKTKVTRFLALDKCLPKRKFLQILDIPSEASKPIELEYDLEWLTIVHLTNHLLSVKSGLTYMPGPTKHERWIFTPTSEEQAHVLKRFDNDLKVPLNFSKTATPFDGNESTPKRDGPARAQINPQTMSFCERLGVDDPMALLLEQSGNDSSNSIISLPSFLTPDKSGDLSCWSLTSGNSSITSQNDDLDDLNLSIASNDSPQPLKRSSLSMPAPKLSSYDNLLPDSMDAKIPPTEESTDENLLLPSTDTIPPPEESTNENLVPPSKDTIPPLEESTKENLVTPSKDMIPPHKESTKETTSVLITAASPLPTPTVSGNGLVVPVTEKSKSPRSEEIDKVEDAAAKTKSETVVPTVKKFKRRNQALYTSIEED